MPRKVFISYDHSEDVQYRRLLQAWDANSNFNFEFDDRSPTVAINSNAAPVIQAALTRKMKEADYLLVIIGRLTYTSDWVRWEITRATEPDVKLRLAAVKIDRDYTTPSGLYGKGTSFAYSFTLANIESALAQATANY